MAPLNCTSLYRMQYSTSIASRLAFRPGIIAVHGSNMVENGHRPAHK